MKTNSNNSSNDIASSGRCARGEAGRSDASILVDAIRQDRLTPRLGWKVQAMIEAGEFGPYEISFMQRIAEAALSCGLAK